MSKVAEMDLSDIHDIKSINLKYVPLLDSSVYYYQNEPWHFDECDLFQRV